MSAHAAVVAVAAGVAAMTITAAVGGSRWILLHRALARRSRVCQLLPTDTFDPRLEDIVQHAATVLSRVRRVTRSLGAQRANAVRVRLELVDGALVYVVEGPERARSLLGRSGYREVEVVAAPAPVDGEGELEGVSDLEATPAQPAAAGGEEL